MRGGTEERGWEDQVGDTHQLAGTRGGSKWRHSVDASHHLHTEQRAFCDSAAKRDANTCDRRCTSTATGPPWWTRPCTDKTGGKVRELRSTPGVEAHIASFSGSGFRLPWSHKKGKGGVVEGMYIPLYEYHSGEIRLTSQTPTVEMLHMATVRSEATEMVTVLRFWVRGPTAPVCVREPRAHYVRPASAGPRVHRVVSAHSETSAGR